MLYYFINDSDHKVVACYLEFYEEGEVYHINNVWPVFLIEQFTVFTPTRCHNKIPQSNSHLEIQLRLLWDLIVAFCGCLNLIFSLLNSLNFYILLIVHCDNIVLCVYVCVCACMRVWETICETWDFIITYLEDIDMDQIILKAILLRSQDTTTCNQKPFGCS